MNIVYLVFGNNMDHYQQVYFSIYTALAYKNAGDRIIVVAENPLLFKSLEENIEIIPINRDLIKKWEGKHEFFWRVKIKALQLIAQKYPLDSILYLDGDTFFYRNMDALRNGLINGQNYMHTDEGKLSSLSSKTERLMWRQMKGKAYHNTIIDENSAMWNAGLIGISDKHFECLELTLEINDAMCADDVTRRLIEQFAFSLGLNKYSALQPADHIVGHYWGNKQQWNKIIDHFLKECFMKNYSIDQIIELVREMDLTQYAINVKESNTQKKLKMFIDQFFKNKKSVYINN
ncbi:hypothetical protein [Kaistella antarctica]|uniref:Nucleotide-diphospho-sugar transferase domain-containing protein n=1 Tax=Kaistella antarctica TaxID=266748 RepID=A0A3S4VGT1_9FLAO|nr:hypothetical protein [Kaistella antarctica]SEV86523.1 hypothetical protein SAMN05421765_0885 [Kaistella antarctica]VEI01318.1 Uncharacterised protein [Kaistella antarctica]